MVNLAESLRCICASISDLDYWISKLKQDYGLEAQIDPSIRDNGSFIFRSCYNILKNLPKKFIDSCKVKYLKIKDLGENCSYYPNHGYYSHSENLIVLNSNIFLDPDEPDDFISGRGYRVSRSFQTFAHELGHAFDAMKGNISFQPDWLRLSGWSKEYKPGLKRFFIQEKDATPKLGEWYYDPKAEFSRFYGKMAPWDDLADSIAYFFTLPDKVPSSKRSYLEALFKYC